MGANPVDEETGERVRWFLANLFREARAAHGHGTQQECADFTSLALSSVEAYEAARAVPEHPGNLAIVLHYLFLGLGGLHAEEMRRRMGIQLVPPSKRTTRRRRSQPQ